MTPLKFKDLDLDKFIEGLKLDELAQEDHSRVDTILNDIECRIKSTLDEMAPLTEIKLGTKTNKTWYSRDLRKLRTKVKNRERVFRKYGEEHQWIALQRERNYYCYQLRKAKSLYYKEGA